MAETLEVVQDDVAYVSAQNAWRIAGVPIMLRDSVPVAMEPRTSQEHYDLLPDGEFATIFFDTSTVTDKWEREESEGSMLITGQCCSDEAAEALRRRLGQVDTDATKGILGGMVEIARLGRDRGDRRVLAAAHMLVRATGQNEQSDRINAQSGTIFSTWDDGETYPKGSLAPDFSRGFRNKIVKGLIARGGSFVAVSGRSRLDMPGINGNTIYSVRLARKTVGNAMVARLPFPVTT